MSSTTPYQILKVDTLYDTVTYDPVIALTLINAFRRIVVIIDNFPDFIYVEIPEYGTKWTTKKIDALFVELDIDMEFGFKYRRKYYNYSEEKYPIITLYSTRSSAFDEVIKVLKQYFVKKYMSINPHIAKSVANRKVEIKKYMANFSMSQKFYAVAKINPGNWILLDESKLKECTEDSDEEDASRERQTEWSHLPTYRLENYRVLKRLEGYPQPEYLPNFRILCLDFEVNSSRTRRFPDPWEPADEIYLVSVVVGESRTMKKYGKIIVDKDLPIPYVQNDNDSEKSKVITVRDEIRLLKRLEKMIRDYDPDFITTYNGSSFDFPYWKARYDSVGEKLGCFGRFIHHPCTFKSNNWSSSAHKSRDQELLVVPGICVFDLYVVTRRDKFYDIYTLDFVSAQVLGEKAKKDEVSAEEQFRIYREGTLEEWKKLLHYSLRDSWAPLQIIEKWNTTTMLLANASIIGINIDDIYSRGQQYRLENMVLQRLLPQGIVIDPPKNVKGEKYKGAIVQEPVLGLQEFLATLDFNSLYPTIMIHFNISHDTFVGTNIEDLPPGLTWDDVNKINVTEEKYHVFVKKHIREGSFPALLRVLLESRAQKKKQMKIEANKDEPDQVIIDNLDAEQLCLKVIANSGYGLLGAREGGKLPLPEGAESVTAMGRKLITDVVEELKRRYNAQIIYGDSVTGDTPILLRRDGIIEIKTIDTIGSTWKSDEKFKPWLPGEKEQDDTIDYEVWSDKGWVKIKRVIRHFTEKKIYEVLTHTGCVRVTEDHSLLDIFGEEITPEECDVGLELMHSFPTIKNKKKTEFDLDKAYIYGFFFGDGSCGKYKTSYGIKYSWALNNKDMSLNEKLCDMCSNIYQCKFKILPTLESSGVYKIVPSCGDLKSFVTEYRDIFYDKNKHKIIPPNILNGSRKEKEAFLEGYFAADGCRKDLQTIGCRRFDTKGQISAMNLFFLLRSLDFNVSINKRSDKDEIFRLTFATGKQRKSTSAIKKIRVIGQIEDYVYDLETENGHFHAGVGQLIVHNTDSVFFRLPEWKAIRSEAEAKERIESTKIISEEITNWIGRPPIKIALDHAYLNYICVKKKCYFSNEIVEVEKPVIIDGVERKETRLVLRFSYKGVPVARREHTKWLKIIYKRCALIALGRCTWEDQQVDIKVRKWNFELSLWDGIMELMQRQVPWEHLYKISQISRPAKEYKAKNYPMRLFLEREDREGRPMGVGERFRWLRVRQEPVEKGEKLYAGNAMRRAIEENEYLDEQFYLDSLKMPMRRISENVFNDKTMYTRMLADIKLKRQYLKELVERPWASWDRKVQNAKCSYKQVPKAERRKNRKTVE